MIDALPWLGVGALGALGALGRFTVDGAVSDRWPSDLPFGTLAVNLSGGFALGGLVGLGVAGDALLVLGTGFLGGYTTFSTWMVEAPRRGRRVAAHVVEPRRADGSGARGHRFRLDPRGRDHMTEALKLWVYFGDSQLTRTDLTSDALMDALARRHVAVSALCRGIEGFGLGRRIHTERFPDVSTDLPLVACAVDSSERIQALLDDVDGVVADGLVTLEYARLSGGEEVADAEFPSQPGRAAKLTIYCGRLERAAVGRRPAYREAVEVLRRHGAAGATALLGVDGTYQRPAQARDLPLAQA